MYSTVQYIDVFVVPVLLPGPKPVLNGAPEESDEVGPPRTVLYNPVQSCTILYTTVQCWIPDSDWGRKDSLGTRALPIGACDFTRVGRS